MVRDRTKVTKVVTNKKKHTPFHIRWKSSTLDDLQGHWQPVRSAILATAKLLISPFFVLIHLSHCRLNLCLLPSSWRIKVSLWGLTISSTLRQEEKVSSLSHSLQSLSAIHGKQLSESKEPLNKWNEWMSHVIVVYFSAAYPVTPRTLLIGWVTGSLMMNHGVFFIYSTHILYSIHS